MNTHPQFSVATSLLYYRYASYRLMHTTIHELKLPAARKLLPGVKAVDGQQKRQFH